MREDSAFLPAEHPQCTQHFASQSNRCLLSSLSKNFTMIDLPPSSQTLQKSLQHLTDSAAATKRPFLMLHVALAVHYQLAWTSGPVHLSLYAAAQAARFLKNPVSVVWSPGEQLRRCAAAATVQRPTRLLLYCLLKVEESEAGNDMPLMSRADFLYAATPSSSDS